MTARRAGPAVRLLAAMIVGAVPAVAGTAVPATAVAPATGVSVLALAPATGVAVPAAATADTRPVVAVVAGVGLPGYCPDELGVTVVIDFNDLDAPNIIRCAPGEQATGLDALRNAGISVTGTTRWGLGFICRIEGKPGPDTEPCINTPPASAYWSYWHASNGGSWTYSQQGVLNRKPPLGSFEGWSFATNKTSTSVPPPGVTPKRPAPPAPPPPPVSSPVAPDPQRTTVGPVPGGTAPGTGTSPGEQPSTPAPAGSLAGSATGQSASADPNRSVVDSRSARSGEPELASGSDGGPPWGTILAVLLVVLLLGGAGWLSYRRRVLEGRTDAEPDASPDPEKGADRGTEPEAKPDAGP